MVQSIPNQDAAAVKSKRPLIITILCILCFIEVITGLLSVLIPGWYPAYLASTGVAGAGFMFFSIAGGLIFTAGLWKMKKWSFYTFLALVIFQQLFYLFIRVWTPQGLIIPLVGVAVCFYYFNKMA